MCIVEPEEEVVQPKEKWDKEIKVAAIGDSQEQIGG
jgi:hypothetical protein